MNKDKILSLLKVLEITSKDQLLEKDILFWWNKKYISLKYEDYNVEQKNQDLINLNNAKDDLEKLDPSTLLKAFDTQDLDREKYKKSKFNNEEDLEEDLEDDFEEDLEEDYINQSSRDFVENNQNNEEDSDKNYEKEKQWEKTSNSSNTYRSNQFNRFNDLKGQIGCLGSIVAFLLFIVIGDQIVRQHALYRLECFGENWLRTEEQIESCARGKWGF